MDEEKEILDLLAEAFNKFSKLSNQHPNEIKDFVDGIHKCQYVLGMRFARKDYPEIFSKK